MNNNPFFLPAVLAGASIPAAALRPVPILSTEDALFPGPRPERLFPSVRPANLAAGTERILTISGFAELTAATGKHFRKQVCAALDGHTTLEIDLSETTVMDCAGLGTLVALRNLLLTRNGFMRLVNPASSIRQFLDLVRAEQIFEIVSS